MRHMKRWFGLFASVVVVALAGGIAAAHEEDFGTVSGTVTYPERMALPDNAEVLVQLLDVSRMDIAATVIASQTILTNGRQVPLEFLLTYDLASISERGTYAVSARISLDGRLTSISDTRYEVINNGVTDVEISVVHVPTTPEATPEAAVTEGTEMMSFGAVTGTVTYLQRIALPDNAVVLVELADISIADAPAFVLASQQFRTKGRQVPFSFALNFDTSNITDSGVYSISARVLVGGELAWISDTVTPVINNGVYDVEIVLVPAR